MAKSASRSTNTCAARTSSQSTCAPSNDNLMELLVMVVRQARVGRTHHRLDPVFRLCRQDRRSRSSVPIAAKLVANMLVAAGVDRAC